MHFPLRYSKINADFKTFFMLQMYSFIEEISSLKGIETYTKLFGNPESTILKICRMKRN